MRWSPSLRTERERCDQSHRGQHDFLQVWMFHRARVGRIFAEHVKLFSPSFALLQSGSHRRNRGLDFGERWPRARRQFPRFQAGAWEGGSPPDKSGKLRGSCYPEAPVCFLALSNEREWRRGWLAAFLLVSFGREIKHDKNCRQPRSQNGVNQTA